MFKINFDLFYELNNGSIISNTWQNVKKYWRKRDGLVEVKVCVDQELKSDWHTSNIIEFPVDGVFQIEKRFPK